MHGWNALCLVQSQLQACSGAHIFAYILGARGSAAPRHTHTCAISLLNEFGVAFMHL